MPLGCLFSCLLLAISRWRHAHMLLEEPAEERLVGEMPKDEFLDKMQKEHPEKYSK